MVMTSELLLGEIEAAFTPLLKALVNYPDSLKIESVVSSNRTVFVSLFSHREDSGVLIGRDGKTAHALRQLLSNLCARYQHRGLLEIVD